MHVPDTNEIISINKSILEEFPQKKADRHHVLSYAKIAIAVQHANEHQEPYAVAAELLVQLVRAHAFASGNKRTSFFCARNVLASVGAPFNILDKAENARVLIGVREGFYNQTDIEKWLRTGVIHEFTR